jgi:hypothetical protein
MADQSLEASAQTSDKKRQMSEKVLENLKRGREIKKTKDEERRKAKGQEKERAKIEKLKQTLVSKVAALKEEAFSESDEEEEPPKKVVKAPRPRPVQEKPLPPRPSSPGIVFV